MAFLQKRRSSNALPMELCLSAQSHLMWVMPTCWVLKKLRIFTTEAVITDVQNIDHLADKWDTPVFQELCRRLST